MKYIISLGGSIIVPHEVDVKYLKKFREAILSAVGQGNRFVIVPGGGATCRRYQAAATSVSRRVSNIDLDWIGIAANKLHTALLKAIFRSMRGVTIEVGGLKPGGTSDTTAVALAKKYGIKNIANLTDVDGFYDRDPKKYANAKLIDRMTWSELRKRFKVSRQPGRELPFDSVAAVMAQKVGIKVVVLSGYNLKNLRDFFAGRRFRGTVIS